MENMKKFENLTSAIETDHTLAVICQEWQVSVVKNGNRLSDIKKWKKSGKKVDLFFLTGLESPYYSYSLVITIPFRRLLSK